MKVYKAINKGDSTIYMIEHWDKDMRSFQLNDNMIFLINGYAESSYHIHPQWKETITGHELEFLEFLNEEPYSLEIESVDSIFTCMEELIEAGECEITSPTY